MDWIQNVNPKDVLFTGSKSQEIYMKNQVDEVNYENYSKNYFLLLPVKTPNIFNILAMIMSKTCIPGCHPGLHHKF